MANTVFYVIFFQVFIYNGHLHIIPIPQFLADIALVLDMLASDMYF